MSKRKRSLRFRLSFFFAILLLAAWSAAALSSWLISMKRIDTFFDTQQMLFAKQLAGASYNPRTAHLPDTDDILAAAGKGEEGEQEDDALAFAVFSPAGRLLLSDGEEGKKFVFAPDSNGFVNTRVDGDRWRIVWLTSLDRSVIVAVGQECEYREEMVFEIMAGQMLPWLLLLPVLLIGLAWMLSRELAPLRAVAVSLGMRDLNDTTPVAINVQSEVLPLVHSLNALFARFGAMLRRERAFIADAAHELRTPLAGLSIQVQVAQNARQPEKRSHALVQLRKSIGRTSRLVDQLLMLFKLESQDADPSGSGKPSLSRFEWSRLVASALEEAREQIEAKSIELAVCDDSSGAYVCGQNALLGVMLGNVIGNAVKYTPEAGKIEVLLNARNLTVRNSSRDIPAAEMARLGERFFRPPGETEMGSGLGLSIVKRIAELHGLIVNLNATSGCFAVTFAFSGIRPLPGSVEDELLGALPQILQGG